MPDFTDMNKVTHKKKTFPGKSYRAIVCNAALRNHRFVWHKVPGGRDVPFFQCAHCPKGHNWYQYEALGGDHIIARAHGGDDEPINLQILCTACNSRDQHHRGASVADRTRGGLAKRAAAHNRHAETSSSDSDSD